MTKKLLIFLTVLHIFSFTIQAQNGKDTKQDSPGKVPTTSMLYEASPAYPFGRLNPNAPKETAQFAFMIGEFDCNDRILNPQTGQWFEMKVVRKGEYILDGYAIQDKNWTPILNSTNIRAFNPKTNEWEVSYFRYPNFSSGIWKGKMEDENIVLRQVNGKTESRLTFFDVTKESYSWKAESVSDGKAVVNWEFVCKRRR